MRRSKIVLKFLEDVYLRKIFLDLKINVTSEFSQLAYYIRKVTLIAREANREPMLAILEDTQGNKIHWIDVIRQSKRKSLLEVNA